MSILHFCSSIQQSRSLGALKNCYVIGGIIHGVQLILATRTLLKGWNFPCDVDRKSVPRMTKGLEAENIYCGLQCGPHYLIGISASQVESVYLKKLWCSRLHKNIGTPNCPISVRYHSGSHMLYHVVEHVISNSNYITSQSAHQIT